jgi:hypothetical protein
VLKAQINKARRNDARGIAQIDICVHAFDATSMPIGMVSHIANLYLLSDLDLPDNRV